MVVIVEFVGTVVMLDEFDYLHAYGIFLAGSFVSVMCFFGFLGLRTSPAGRAPLQILGISTTLIVLLFAAVVLVSHHGDDLTDMAPFVGLGFVLPAIVLTAYLILALRGSGRHPPPLVQDGSIEGPSVPRTIQLFDAKGIVYATLLTTLVPVSISILNILFRTSPEGIQICCPALLLIAAVYMGFAALRKGTGLHWTLVSTQAVILFGCFTLLAGLDWEEEFMTYFGILVLIYGFIAAIALIIDAWTSPRRSMYG